MDIVAMILYHSWRIKSSYMEQKFAFDNVRHKDTFNKYSKQMTHVISNLLFYEQKS